MLLLLYFACDGVSPLAYNPVAMRTVATVSAGGIVVDRATKLFIFMA